MTKEVNIIKNSKGYEVYSKCKNGFGTVSIRRAGIIKYDAVRMKHSFYPAWNLISFGEGLLSHVAEFIKELDAEEEI